MIHLIPLAITMHCGLAVPVKANTSQHECLIWTAQCHNSIWEIGLIESFCLLCIQYNMNMRHTCLMFFGEASPFNVGQNSKQIYNKQLSQLWVSVFLRGSFFTRGLWSAEAARRVFLRILVCFAGPCSLLAVGARTAGYSGQQLTRHDPWKRFAEVCSLDVLGIGKDMKRL